MTYRIPPGTVIHSDDHTWKFPNGSMGANAAFDIMSHLRNMVDEVNKGVPGANEQLNSTCIAWGAQYDEKCLGCVSCVSKHQRFAVEKSTQPLAVSKIRDYAELSIQMTIRQLGRVWRTAENPVEREAAYSAMMRYKGDV